MNNEKTTTKAERDRALIDRDATIAGAKFGTPRDHWRPASAEQSGFMLELMQLYARVTDAAARAEVYETMQRVAPAWMPNPLGAKPSSPAEPAGFRCDESRADVDTLGA